MWSACNAGKTPKPVDGASRLGSCRCWLASLDGANWSARCHPIRQLSGDARVSQRACALCVSTATPLAVAWDFIIADPSARATQRRQGHTRRRRRRRALFVLRLVCLRATTRHFNPSIDRLRGGRRAEIETQLLLHGCSCCCCRRRCRRRHSRSSQNASREPKFNVQASCARVRITACVQ